MADFVMRGFPGIAELRLRDGDVIRLTGHNGAGKTSLLRQLAGLEAPMRATFTAWTDGSAERAAWVPENALDGLVGLTVAGEARFRDVPLEPAIVGLADRDVATLSSGEARRVAIAVQPKRRLLLLDEPLEGLDEERLAAVRRRIERHKGIVVFADQAGQLADLATRVVALGRSASYAEPELMAIAGDPVLVASEKPVQVPDQVIPLPAIEFGPGFHAVAGRNGCGKTTLLRRLAGIEDDEGVTIAGQPVSTGKNVRLLGPVARDHLAHERVADELNDTAAWAREALVPDALLSRHPWSLSAGEQKRVALAKCLGRDAAVYLLDEPEAHLDVAGRNGMWLVIGRRLQEGKCIVAASHDRQVLETAQEVFRWA